jgi:hypothetical protein
MVASEELRNSFMMEFKFILLANHRSNLWAAVGGIGDVDGSRRGRIGETFGVSTEGNRRDTWLELPRNIAWQFSRPGWGWRSWIYSSSSHSCAVCLIAGHCKWGMNRAIKCRGIHMIHMLVQTVKFLLVVDWKRMWIYMDICNLYI